MYVCVRVFVCVVCVFAYACVCVCVVCRGEVGRLGGGGGALTVAQMCAAAQGNGQRRPVAAVDVATRHPPHSWERECVCRCERVIV